MARRAAKLCAVFQRLWGCWPCSCFVEWILENLCTCPGSTLARVAPVKDSVQIARISTSVVACLSPSLDLINAAPAPRLLFPAPDTASSPAPVHKAPRQRPPRLRPPDSLVSTPAHAPPFCISTARPPPHNGNARSNQRCKSISCVQFSSLPVF